MWQAPSVAPNAFQVLLPRPTWRDPVMSDPTADMVAVPLEEWERVTSTLVSLEDEYKALRWVVAIMLARNGNEVRITDVELVTAESDDLLTMEQDPIDKSWTIRRESGLD